MAIGKKQYTYLVVGCIIISFVVDAIALPFFNNTIAIHFDANGNVNGVFYKMIIFLIPSLMMLILCIKDSLGNRIFLHNDTVLAEPYKAIIGCIAAVICCIANLYIVIFNVKMDAISIYYFVEVFIMLLIILAIVIVMNKVIEKRNVNKVVLLSILLCFFFQILTIFFDVSIFNWLSSATLIFGVVFLILKNKKKN